MGLSMKSLPILGMLLSLALFLFSLVGVALLLTGYTSAKLGKAPTKTAMIRNLAIGLLTMGVTFLLGQLFSI